MIGGPALESTYTAGINTSISVNIPREMGSNEAEKNTLRREDAELRRAALSDLHYGNLDIWCDTRKILVRM
jgi:hypothetical protein